MTAPPAEFWTPRKVAWYERALARGDYAATVLGALAPVLAECETALDVGAGCGALALPLAERLRRVTAVEQHGRERRPLQPLRGRWGWRDLQQGPDPRLIARRTEGEHLGVEPLELLPQAIRHPIQLHLQVLLDPGQFPEVDDPWVVDAHAPKRGLIGPQGVGQHERIAPVVLGAGHAVAITKAVELFRVEGEDVEPSLEQRLHDGAPRDFDRHGHALRLPRGELRQPLAELPQRASGVGNRALCEHPTVAVEDRHLVSRSRPIHSDVQQILNLGHFVSSFSIARLVVVPRRTLYWRSQRNSPPDVQRDRPRWGATPPKALMAPGPVGAPQQGSRGQH